MNANSAVITYLIITFFHTSITDNSLQLPDYSYLVFNMDRQDVLMQNVFLNGLNDGFILMDGFQRIIPKMICKY